MTGPEHYAEAERLIGMYESGTHDWARDWGSDTLASAQVHATLALTAATALQGSGVPADGATGYEWRQTICAPERQAS